MELKILNHQNTKRNKTFLEGWIKYHLSIDFLFHNMNFLLYVFFWIYFICHIFLTKVFVHPQIFIKFCMFIPFFCWFIRTTKFGDNLCVFVNQLS